MVKKLSSEMTSSQEVAAQVNMDEGVFGNIPFFTSNKSRNNEEIEEKSGEFELSQPGGDGKKRSPQTTKAATSQKTLFGNYLMKEYI
jgi:hypothetical protein